MINFKKGPALSLHQVNYVAAPISATEGIEAGMVVRLDAVNGKAYKGFNNGSGSAIPGISQQASVGVFGVAINSQTSGDVIESGKIGIYALDGATVIETDQYDTSKTDYTPGRYLTTDAAGKFVSIADATAIVTDPTVTVGTVKTARIVGQVVEGVHTLENKKTATFGSGNFQTSVNVITVKLAV